MEFLVMIGIGLVVCAWLYDSDWKRKLMKPR